MTRRLTRRQLLERAALGGAALSVPNLLAACGGGGIEGGDEAGEDTAAADRTLRNPLRISNWPLYIDIDEDTKERPTIQQFMAQYDIAVNYVEDINDNDQFFGKIQGPLSQGQSIERDIVVLTDWMAARLIRMGWVERLDKEAIPNFDNLVDALASPRFDANRDYSLPWQSGMTGIGYNAERAGEITSVEQLLEDEKLKGKVTLLTEMPDTVGLVMQANGDDPTEVSGEAFDRAIERIQAALDSGQIRQFTGNDYGPALSRGDVWACFAWSGDIVQLQLDNPGLRFAIPESGGMIWSDNMLIPKGGHAFTASTFMNFVYDPKVQAQIEAYVNFIPPVEGTKEAMQEVDPELVDNPLIFPDEEMLARVKIFDAEAADDTELKQKFQTLIGA